MPKLTEPAGKFLTNKDVATGDILTFIDSGTEHEEDNKFKPGSKKLKFEIGVRLDDGTEKVVSVNDTSKRNLMDEYGEDSDTWLGKNARVEILTQKVGNEFKDVLYLTSPMRNLKGDLLTA